MNYNKYNPRCNNGTKWSYGYDGAVGEDDVDDDLDEAHGDDDDDMAMISPSGRVFPRQISPCRRAFSLSVVSAQKAAAEYFFEAPPSIFRSKGSYTRKGAAGGGTGPPGGPQARPRVGPYLGGVWAPCGPPPVALLAPLVFWRNNNL